jgi:hypothetical protein
MENIDSLYGLTKGSTLKVDVVGENSKRRRLIVLALFIAKLVKTNSGEILGTPTAAKKTLTAFSFMAQQAAANNKNATLHGICFYC